MKSTIAGVDLAKDVIQVCLVKGKRVILNKEFTIEQFVQWIVTSKPMSIVFESCSTSNYWKQFASEQGHDARIISAKLVANIRQNQKTDSNDALAIVQASQLIKVKFIKGKSFSQQELQSLQRMRGLAKKQEKALGNQIKALLLEFNIRITTQAGGIKGVVQEILENAENGFCDQFREGLHMALQQYLQMVSNLASYDKLLNQAIKPFPDCQKLMALEGVGTLNAINLYLAIDCEDMGTFKTGRDVAACIGLTPVQHSTGGKVKLGSISKKGKNSREVRSTLISGAMSVVKTLINREPKTKKERWLKQLMERRGNKCAAVALANKTVRTAFSLLTKGTYYEVQALTENSM